MPSANRRFADYCCELLACIGQCEARRMFGGWGLRVDGLSVAIVTDLGSGDRLWLKADDECRALYEAAGCERFTYAANGVTRSMNYYSAPDDALESPQLMAPWARLALTCAVRAQSAKVAAPRPATKSQASKPKPAARRAAAPAPKVKAARKSAKG